jgi:two-component system sensor histidine kinase KdpD
MLQRQLEHLFRLVNVERGGEPLDLKEESPTRLLEEAIQISGRQGVQYQVEGLPNLARFDMGKLARAVANLIDNAVKFSPPSSLVKIRSTGTTLGEGAEAVEAMAISVLDRGPGVDAQDRERIFAPFEQGGDPLTGKPQGIGIGLHEARTLVRRHGGSVTYAPREGGGSEFRIVVPLDPSAKVGALEPTGA